MLYEGEEMGLTCRAEKKMIEEKKVAVGRREGASGTVTDDGIRKERVGSACAR